MAGVNGPKFPAIREHLAQNIAGVYKDMDTTCGVVSFLVNIRLLIGTFQV